MKKQVLSREEQLEKKIESLEEVIDRLENKYEDLDMDIYDVLEIIRKIKNKTEMDVYYCRYALYSDLEEIESYLNKYNTYK